MFNHQPSSSKDQKTGFADHRKKTNNVEVMASIFQEAGSILSDEKIPDTTDKNFLIFISPNSATSFPTLHIVAMNKLSSNKLATFYELESENKDTLCAIHNTSLSFNKKISNSKLPSDTANWIYSITLTPQSIELLQKAVKDSKLITQLNESLSLAQKANTITAEDLKKQGLEFIEKLKTKDNKLIEPAKLITSVKTLPEILMAIKYLENEENLNTTELAKFTEWQKKYDVNTIRNIQSELDTLVENMENEVASKGMQTYLAETQLFLENLCIKYKLPSIILLNDHGRFMINPAYSSFLECVRRLDIGEANTKLEEIMLSPERTALFDHLKAMNTSQSSYLPLEFLSCDTQQHSIWNRLPQPSYIQCQAPTFAHQYDYGMSNSVKESLGKLFTGIDFTVPGQTNTMKLISAAFEERFNTLEQANERWISNGAWYAPNIYLEGLQYGTRLSYEGENLSEIQPLYSLYRNANFQFIPKFDEKNTLKNKKNHFLIIPRTMMEYLTVKNTLVENPELEKNDKFIKEVIDVFLSKFSSDLKQNVYTQVPDHFFNLAAKVYPNSNNHLDELKKIVSENKNKALIECRDNMFNTIKNHVKQPFYKCLIKEIYSEEKKEFIPLPWPKDSTGQVNLRSKEVDGFNQKLIQFINSINKSNEFNYENFNTFLKTLVLSDKKGTNISPK